MNDLQGNRGAVAFNAPVNGARSTENSYILDGAYNTDRNVFAIAVVPLMEIGGGVPDSELARARGVRAVRRRRDRRGDQVRKPGVSRKHFRVLPQ